MKHWFSGLQDNIALKRDAPFRGGFEGLLFFRLGWLRQSSVKARPLALRYVLNKWNK
ncbi:MAG: hypothetical protein ABL933_02425 [Methyloglobulus sp.]